MNRANIWLEKGETQKAITDFSKAIELMPSLRSAYDGRAKAYKKIGKPSLATADKATSDGILQRIKAGRQELLLASDVGE
jgi:Tfp pilus assembly protein PilF